MYFRCLLYEPYEILERFLFIALYIIDFTNFRRVYSVVNVPWRRPAGQVGYRGRAGTAGMNEHLRFVKQSFIGDIKKQSK